MSGKCPTSQRNIHHRCVDDDEVWSWWWLGVLSSQNYEIGLWCNPWSCEPSESYGNIMRAKWPSPNMPWSDPNFNSAPIKLPNLREKLTVAEQVRLGCWEHLISVLKSYNNWEDSEKFAKNAMQILCIKLEQLWWYIAELSCIHPASALWKVFQCWDMASYHSAGLNNKQNTHKLS